MCTHASIRRLSAGKKTTLWEFGNDCRISQARIRKVTEGSVLCPHNGEDMQDFTDDVRGCGQARWNRFTHLRMVKIIERLPMHLQSRWCKEAVRSKETEGKYPDILVVLEFLDRMSKEMNDPVFGTLHKDFKSKPKPNKNLGHALLQRPQNQSPRKWTLHKTLSPMRVFCAVKIISLMPAADSRCQLRRDWNLFKTTGCASVV